jgi:hypothetical protein
MGTICDLVKAYDTVNREMEDPHNSTRKLNRSAQKLYTDVTINSERGNPETSFSRQVKQGDNLAPVLLSLSSTQYPTLSTEMGFHNPDFRWFPDTQVSKVARDNYWNRNLQTGTMFSFFKSIMSMIRPSFFSAARSDRRLQAYRLHFRRFV